MTGIKVVIDATSINVSKVIEIYQPYAPDSQCFNWCVVQQVAHSNNMELSGIIFIVFAYIFIVFYETANEIPLIKPYRENFIYYAKLLLMVFFGYYFLILRMRLIW